MFCRALLSLSLALSGVASAAPTAVSPAPARAAASSSPADVAPSRRELQIRTITIDDTNADTVHELRVARGVPTTLVFRTPLAAGQDSVLLAAPAEVFGEPLSNRRTLVLGPERDLRADEFYPLTLTFEDGTVQTFKVVSRLEVVDTQVEVVLALQARAAPDSPAALRTSLAQLRGQLDECQATSATAGIAHVSSLVLAQDVGKPTRFIAERVELRHLDKQSRLLVQVRSAYRLFSETYVLMTVENREPGKSWVLDRAEVRLEGSGESAGAQVLVAKMEVASLPSGEETKAVVTFQTPPQTADTRFTLLLYEKGGNRHVRLDGVRL